MIIFRNLHDILCKIQMSDIFKYRLYDIIVHQKEKKLKLSRKYKKPYHLNKCVEFDYSLSPNNNQNVIEK